MSNIITIGYSAEGNTDRRFLESILKKTFEEIAFNCNGVIEVFDPIFFEFPKSLGFVASVEQLSVEAFKTGISVLCIHTDADSNLDKIAFKNKINPALENIQKSSVPDICRIIVPIVPVQMIEAWMLANKQILKEELNTSLSDNALGLNRIIENISDPKTLLENAIEITQQNISQRRKRLTLNDIYQPIGQKLNISDLEKLESFKKFQMNVEEAFRKLNYLV